MADAASSPAADGAAVAPAPSAAELLEAEVWLLATPAQQYKAFLRVFALAPAAHANRESLIQEQMFNVISYACSMPCCVCAAWVR
jgi:hypothetical protein